ncbi:PAS domain-containing sensor histidine kinase [Halorubrum sp. RMP-47]|uniref:histidine kinase n=1 Tax=Halorubrum miltondacostae TaxID=3076378 RepID=A0ABD5M5X2_9EURY
MTSSSDNSSYHAHVEKAPIGIFEVNEHGEYVDVNEAAGDMVGYSRHELLDMSVADLAPEQDDPEEIPSFTEVRETGHMRTEGQIRHKNGHTVDIIFEAVELEEGRLVAYVQDISEEKQYEKALERTRDELRQIIDLIPDPIFVKNRDDEILLSNEANAELLGTIPEEIEGKPEPEFFPESDQYETLRQRDIEVIESGESAMFEEEVTSLATEKHIFQTSRIPFKTPEIGEEAVFGYARDITELREYEQELEDQRDNLEILNQVLRHDVRNDLQLVTAYADLLVEECEDEEVKGYITTIQDSADHAIELTRTAREIADVMLSTTKEGQQVNLRAILENEVSEVQSSYPNAAVSLETTVSSVTINANDMLSSVFRNLLKNAIQHNDKAVAEVTTSVTEQDDIATIQIADNGPGVPDGQKDDIFAKGERGLESAGSGMGLYLVATLVTDYGGEVWVEDNDPEGSVFVVELPKTE